MPPFAFTGGRFAEGIVFATIGFSSHGITLLEHVHLLERFVQYNVIVYGVEDCGKLEGGLLMIRWNQYVSVHETRAQVTREKLLKAAIKLVNRDGMKQLTVRNICDEAGLSTGSFYNLFSGKEDLISYYLKYAFAPYREKALEGSDEYGPVERVLLLYRAYVEYCKDMGLEFVSGLYASNHNPFFDFMHRDAEDDFIIVSVRNYLAEAIELGIVRDDVDLDEAMLRIAAASTGLLFYWCVFDGDIDIEYEVDEAIKTYLLSITVDPNMKLNIEPLESKGCFLK